MRLYFKTWLIFYLTKFLDYAHSIIWLHEFHERLNEYTRKSHEVDKDQNIVSIISRIDTSGKESLLLMLIVETGAKKSELAPKKSITKRFTIFALLQ